MIACVICALYLLRRTETMITGIRCAASRRNGLCGSASIRKALFGTAADTCEDTLRLSTAVAQQALQSFTSRIESDTIGTRYDLGAEIGRGRFGRVQEAVCKETGEALAVKSSGKQSLRLANVREGN